MMFTEHGRHYPDVVGRPRRVINRLLLARLATETNAVCRFSADALRAVDGFSGVPVGVVENGIDPFRYRSTADVRAARQEVGLDAHREYIANIARFHPVKDQASLVDAFHRVASARDDVDLLLVGDGPLRPEIEGQVGRLGLETRVKFLGIRRDVPDVLAASTVFCLNSVSEAASLTLMEAMAAGRPVVVTDVGGNPEIVREGVDGLLVPRQDPGALAAALLQVLDSPEVAHRMGEAGAARVRDVYRIDRTVQRYFELYSGMLN